VSSIGLRRGGTPSLAELQARRLEILDVTRRRGAHGVRVFGSVARGTQGPGSDVDLLVRVEPGRSLLDLGGCTADLEDLLECSVDLVTLEELRASCGVPIG
jgi:predicted nucleotidyltransferase